MEDTVEGALLTSVCQSIVMPRAPGLRVPTQQGQHVLQRTARMCVIDPALKLRTHDTMLFIPLIRSLTSQELRVITGGIDNASVIVTEFPYKLSYPRSLLDAVAKQIPSELHKYVPKSLDIIGRVALVQIPAPLDAWKNEIGHAIKAVNRHVETVLEKVGNVEGVQRLRRYEVLVGSDNTSTIHKEYGCVYHVDPQTVYFTPRLSEERHRIATLPQNGEVIVDMFTSIGAFALQIAKINPRVVIYAIDINPAAYHLLQRNIAANRVTHVVHPRHGNVRDVTKDLEGTVDRVIMDLPEHAEDFIDAACLLLKPTGGIIHFYGFAADPNAVDTIQQRLQTSVLNTGRHVHTILYSHKIRPIAPRRWQVVLDAHIQ
jgi:tRNA (guanine37-N1)-methyltransferase